MRLLLWFAINCIVFHEMSSPCVRWNVPERAAALQLYLYKERQGAMILIEPFLQAKRAGESGILYALSQGELPIHKEQPC
jgi:hypothetical protein